MKHLVLRHVTIAQSEQLIKNGSPDNRDKDHVPVIKLFLPGTGCTWLLTEIDPDEPSLAFGLCDLGMGFPELGYVDLDELGSIKTRLGLGVERDISFKGKYPISVYASAARACKQIAEDENILNRYAQNLRLKPKL